MSAHHFEAIAKNTDRIATCLEGFLADSREARDIDVKSIIEKAMQALRDANPAFDLAFKEMERRAEVGPG